MAPVDGAISGTPYSDSSGRMAWLCGVPRVRNSASTLSLVISSRALAAALAGSNLSSSATILICSPLTPPAALTWSIHSLAPAAVSLTPAATGPLKSAVWPTRMSAWARLQAAQARMVRLLSQLRCTFGFSPTGPLAGGAAEYAQVHLVACDKWRNYFLPFHDASATGAPRRHVPHGVPPSRRPARRVQAT